MSFEAVQFAKANNPVATLEDIGYFDPEYTSNGDVTQMQHLYTSDVIVFVAKLRRTARSKNIVNVDQYLRGSALRLYRIGFGFDGTNIFDYDDGHCLVEHLAEALVAAFGKDSEASRLVDKEHSLTDASNGHRAFMDYAFDLLELGFSAASQSRHQRISKIRCGTNEDACWMCYFASAGLTVTLNM
ncbi:hypothetical protein MBLNU459_g4872t1 [Dothideomycetes sp. NU459]